MGVCAIHWLARSVFALVAGTSAFHAHSAEIQSGKLSPQPLVEVVAFGVAPVTATAYEPGVRPQPGDMLHHAAPTAPDAQSEVETRALFGETWTALFQRVADKLNPTVLSSAGVTSRIALLPALESGKYVRLRSIDGGAKVEIDYVVQAEQAYSITLAADGIQVRPRASDPRVSPSSRSPCAGASMRKIVAVGGQRDDRNGQWVVTDRQ